MSRRNVRVATKKERQRRLAREAHARRLERHALRARRTRLWSVIGVAVVVVAAVGVGLAAILGAFSGTGSNAKAASVKSPAATTPSATPTPSPSNTAAMVDGKCVYTAAGTASRKVTLPSATPDLTAKYTATVTTNRGTIVIDLLGSQAPCTVGSFVSLASQKYFSNTPCHRLTTKDIYVLQCGDPTGTGSGGPGYGFNSENLTSLKQVPIAGSTTKLAVYPAGIVAMANTGQPGSNGSQFFLVYKKTQLGDNYTPFGQIVSGLNIIQAVASAGTDNSNGTGDGHPKEKVQIESVTISKA
jgi:peptidyl-prolyl cis-trans isomerase B (cyclophilin B)